MDAHHFRKRSDSGLAFLVWRTVLIAYLGFVSLRALTRGEILPLLLLAPVFSSFSMGSSVSPQVSVSASFLTVFVSLPPDLAKLRQLRPRRRHD